MLSGMPIFNETEQIHTTMIRIISDSTCDLSAALLNQYSITILPLRIHLGEDTYEDGLSISPDDIYRWSDANNATPKTSAVSLEKTKALFTSILADGNEIICFSISGKMSSTNHIMHLAAEELNAQDKIHIIDSENLSTGIGLLVIEAAIMAQQDAPAVQIVRHIDTLKSHVKASFVVDTLTYLQRGGRCSSITAAAGNLLQFHPRIIVENGQMRAAKKYRGKMNSVLLAYVKDMEANLKAARPDRIFITHSGCDEKTIQTVRQYLQELNVFHEILITRAGGVISSHCGPGTLGVLFIEN